MFYDPALKSPASVKIIILTQSIKLNTNMLYHYENQYFL